MDELLGYYFQKGFSYKNMLLFLSKYHDTEMSMQSLQQQLHDMGLKRRIISYNIQEIWQEIVKNLNGPGCSGGYRSHWHALRLKGIQVPRRVAEELCHELVMKERLTAYSGDSIRIPNLISHGIPMGMINLNRTDSVEECFG